MPSNTSRGAGAPAPTSAAATAPMAGAHHGESPSSFYAPGDDTIAKASPFTESVLRDHASLGERLGSADREVVETMAAEAITDPNDLEAEIARIRSIRKPLGAYSQKLALEKRPGYHRHWFNDIAGRVEEAAANGWAHVKGKDGKPISRCVGSGRDKGALYAFAMELPEVFWLEDQAARHQVATDKVDALKRSPVRAEPGTAKPSDKGKFYDPTESGDILQIQKI